MIVCSNIHDLRALQLAVHRMLVGLSDLVRQCCPFLNSFDHH